MAGLSDASTIKAESLVPAVPPSLPASFELAPVEAETYVYVSLSDLKADLWSFEDFVKNNAWKWVGSEREGNLLFTEVDRRRSTMM